MKLYQETKFKETKIGDIPNDWKVRELGEFTKFQESYVLTRGTQPAHCLSEDEEHYKRMKTLINSLESKL